MWHSSREKRMLKTRVINISVGDSEDLVLNLLVMNVAPGF